MNEPNYSNNWRLKSVSVDSLVQVAADEFDEKIDAKQSKFYVGKVGQLVPGSFMFHNEVGCSTVVIEFLNGYQVTVLDTDVESTEDPATSSEYLPVLPTDDYRKLTAEEKQFADKVVLTMIATNDGQEIEVIFLDAIDAALARTDMYKRRWRRTD